MVDFPSKSESLITVTTPSQSIWVLELHNGDDSRLSRYMIEQAFYPALDFVEFEWRKQWKIANERGLTRKAVPGSDASLQANWKYNDVQSNPVPDLFDGSGALIITGNLNQDKYFCNGTNIDAFEIFRSLITLTLLKGLDFSEAISQKDFFLVPVIASINGHAFAGGWITAVASDYRVIGDWKLWACMNEVHFGSDFPLLTALFLRSSFRSTPFIRKLMLQGHRFNPLELLAEGAVDKVVSTADHNHQAPHPDGEVV
ncbi:hypothetical protein Clacol_007321 [Clathrus columnatus]|uniref:Uncharacterized protein n=1 Tax=Clathrus columnatus TaxID=1419009 RepID=A0AAV5AH63_9AGAM|nr:hypothetical protein Clacol_007321 [Clathrus columnatus]